MIRRGLVLWALMAAAGCEPAPEVTTLPLGLRSVMGCPIGALESLDVTALGDFPSHSASLPTSGPSTAFESLPAGTRELAVRVTTQASGAFGRYVFGATEPQRSVLLLPDARSCTLAGDLLKAGAGTAVAALPGGGLLLSGGASDRDYAVNTAVVWYGQDELGSYVPGDGMFLRRAYASATAWDGAVVIAGGAGGMLGNAHDTFEVFDDASGRFVGARGGRLKAPRMQHAALALPDGKLLLAGGRAAPNAAALASAELVDVEARSGETLEGLEHARFDAQLLLLDSGTVLLAGGRDQAGPLGSIERFDPDTRRFQTLIDDLPVRSELAIAALPGARVAWLTCEVGGRGCELSLLFERATGLEPEVLPLSFGEFAGAGLSQIHLFALDSGRLLLTAADDSDHSANRRAFLIDVSAGELTPLSATRIPSALAQLRSGELVELDEMGASLRAAERLGRYDSPSGNLLDDASEYVALDSASHWSREDQGLRARAGSARLDLVPLRFAALRLELEVEGDAELLFSDAPGPRISGAELVLGACSHELQRGMRLSVTRTASQLTVSDPTRVLCSSAITSPGPFGVGVRAPAGTLLRWLSVERP